MPLLRGSSRATIAANIRDMVKAGHPQRVAVAAALHTADKSRKGSSPMAKKTSGLTPRKAMAGAGSSSDFDADDYNGMNDGSGPHPDHTGGTGEAGAMPDNQRSAPPAINHTKGHHPAQAAPNHGHTHPGGHGNHHTYNTEKV